MFIFVVEVVIVSVVASLFATWVKLVPRYPKRSQVFLQQLINTVLLTILLTLLAAFDIYPSWVVVFVMIVVVIWLSVQITDRITRKKVRTPSEISEGSREESETQ